MNKCTLILYFLVFVACPKQDGIIEDGDLF